MASRGKGGFRAQVHAGVVEERTRLLAILNKINVPAARGLNPETDDITEVVDKTIMGMIGAFKELSVVMEAQRQAMAEELMRCDSKTHDQFKKALSDGDRLDKETK